MNGYPLGVAIVALIMYVTNWPRKPDADVVLILSLTIIIGFVMDWFRWRDIRRQAEELRTLVHRMGKGHG